MGDDLVIIWQPFGDQIVTTVVASCDRWTAYGYFPTSWIMVDNFERVRVWHLSAKERGAVCDRRKPSDRKLESEK